MIELTIPKVLPDAAPHVARTVASTARTAVKVMVVDDHGMHCMVHGAWCVELLACNIEQCVYMSKSGLAYDKQPYDPQHHRLK